MGRTRTTLVAVAFALVSCSAQATPAATPLQQVNALRIYTTSETAVLLENLSSVYRQSQPQIAFETTSGSFEALAARILRENGSYFLSHFLPDDIDSPTSRYWAAPVGQDALTVIVHPQNPVRSITMAQFRDIYSGSIASWDALGGIGRDIVVVAPDGVTALRGEFAALVMGERAITPNAQVVPNQAAMLRTIARLPDAVGIASLSAIDESVQPLQIDGIAPSADSVYDSTYPLRTTIYIVGRREPLDDDYPDMRAFIGWVQSLEGQQVVGQRYAPLLRP